MINYHQNVQELEKFLTKALNGIVQKRTWESYFWSFYSPVPKIASLVAQYKDGIKNHIQLKIKKEEAAVKLHNKTEKDNTDLETFRSQEKTKNGSESRDFLKELEVLRDTNAHQELSEIVTQQWNGITISKDDFLETMAKIKALIDIHIVTSLHHEQIDFTHYRPNKEDVEEENDAAEVSLEKIEVHFKSIITTAQVAAGANHAEDFSAQLQDVQCKLNFLLLHRHVAGENVQTLISNDTQKKFDNQRSVFNTIISETKHAAVKKADWVNVDALKKEIARLKDFYSSARDALSLFHNELSDAKQNDFANHVKELIISKGSTNPCMTSRVEQLENYLKELEKFKTGEYDANHGSNREQNNKTMDIMNNLKSNYKVLTDRSAALIQATQKNEGLTGNKELQAAIQKVKAFFVDSSGKVCDTENFRKIGIVSSKSSENESRLTMNDQGRTSGSGGSGLSFFNCNSDHIELETSLVLGGGA